MLSRRQFLAVPAAFALGSIEAQSDIPDWGVPVIDLHHHLRRDAAANLAHMDGAGIARAVLLTDVRQEEAARALIAQYPARFVRFSSANVGAPARPQGGVGPGPTQALQQLRAALEVGAKGVGEMKSAVAVDSPEMRRIYELAAEFGVPVQLHFQEVSQQLSPGTYNTGIDRFPAILRAYPNTTFIGHADAFWANISADVSYDTAYPSGPVKRGGLTDRMLSEFPNLWADLAATSGRNALARDPDFSGQFLNRHQDKLMFGSDCGCADGRGTGQTNPLPLIAGKCVARETLTALKQLTSPDVFAKIAAGNVTRLLKL